MMSSDPPSTQREREVFALFVEVCNLDPEAREQALAACGDEELADEVWRKLEAQEVGGVWSGTTVLDTLKPTELDTLRPTEPTELLRATELQRLGSVESNPRPVQIGDRVGPFEIRDLLGEGGMGQVFRAVQQQPVRREVALKIVPLGRLKGTARVRFDAERQAMARLDHPNIGRILEAGTTDDGQPYFAMELIDGPPITAYCDRAKLTLEQRLRLFVEVCRGTHHAHLKLLLHRDLKPSNVLVAEVDGRPVPKIIDFGIAKGLGDPLVTLAALTGDGFVGTPAYMSPEALESGEEVDARSDVFALGVLLYKLLTGGLPWGAESTRDPLQLVKSRLERDAERPVAQLSRLDAEKINHVAGCRGLDADGLAKRLRGDLDSLVMKALEPQPERRYDSAAELADDIERHLSGEPIRARPLTTGVLLGKLIRRHRLPVLASLVVVLALVVGSIGLIFGLVRAQQAEQEALASKELAVAEAAAATEARDEADAVAEFLTGIFAAANTQALDADRPPGEINALELLESGAERIETDLADQPLIRARLERTLGHLFANLGEVQRSLEWHRAAVSTLEAEDAPPPFSLARSYHQLASAELRAGDREGAASHLEQALTLLETLPGEEAQRLRAPTLNLAARLERRGGDLAKTEALYQEAIGAYKNLGEEFAPSVANVRHNLGGLYLSTGRFEEAEAQFLQALEIYRPRVEDGHPKLAEFSMGLAGAIASQGRLEEAAVLFEAAERDIRERRGEDHYTRATALKNLGMLNRDLGRFDQAEAYFRQALAIQERTFGEEHPRVARSLGDLARLLSSQGRDKKARPLQERALKVFEAVFGEDHPEIAKSLEHLGTMALRRGDVELARDFAGRAYKIRVAKLPADDPTIGSAAAELGEALWHLNRRDEARRYFEEAQRIFEDGGASTAESFEELKARLVRLHGTN